MDDITKEFEEWKPLLKALVELRLLKEENEILKNQVRALTELAQYQEYGKH